MSYLFGGTPFDGYDAGGRRSLNGGGGGGGQQQSTQTSYQTNIPAYLQGPAERMVARGETLSEQGYIPYEGARTAEFNPAQTQAFQDIAGLQAPGQFGQAGEAVTGAQQFGTVGALGAMGYQSGQFGSQQAQQYMSPYQQAVTDIAKREAATEAQRLNTELGSKAAKAGAFGGSRFGIEQALLGSKLAQNLSDIQVKGSQAAFENAQQQFERDRAARLAGAKFGLEGAQFGADVGLKSAAQLGQLGTAEQEANLKRISAQQAAGAQQQALEQQKLDQAYQQFQEQRDWEKNQLGFLSGLIRGTPFSTSQLQTTSAPGATTASQLASIGLGAYGLSSLLGKKEGGAIKGYAKGGNVEGYAYGGDISAYTDKQLQDAAMGKSDIIPAEDAKQELARRAKLRTAVQGVRAEEELASGVAGLPADNMEFADGGIVGYAAGDLVTIGGKTYTETNDPNFVMVNGVRTSRKAVEQMVGNPWSTPAPAADYKPSTKAFLGEQDKERDAQYFAEQKKMREDIASGKGINWKGGFYPIIQEGENKGKVDYKGVPTAMNMFPGATGAVPAMPTTTPWKSDTGVAPETAAPAATPAPAHATASAAAPAAAPTSSGRPGAGIPGAIPGTPAAGNVVAGLPTNGGDFFEQMMAASERYRKKQADTEGDPFSDTRAAMAEQKRAYQDMRSEGRGLAALQAAAAIAQGGPGGTLGQIGRGMGALGEAGFKLQNQLQAARQAEMNSRVMLSQAEEARNRGLRSEANQYASAGIQAGLQATKLKQDYQLGMAQIRASQANAAKNQNIEFYDWLSKNPKALEVYREARAPQEKPLSDADILKSWDPMKYPGMTYAQYYASMKNAGSMAPTSSLSAADQALVNKYAK